MAHCAQAAKSCGFCEKDQDVQFHLVKSNENMCISCISNSKTKITENEKVILISEIGEETKPIVILCGIHSQEEIIIYCEKCDKLICYECLNGKHCGHKIESLKKMKDTANEQLENLRKKLKHREDSNKETLTELTYLKEKEDKRYSEACSNIKKQQEVLTKAQQTIQNAIDTRHPASMLQAKEEVTKCTGELDNLTPAKLDSPKLQQAQIQLGELRQHLGSVHTKADVNTSLATNINKGEIDMRKIKTRSIVKVEGKRRSIKVIIPTKKNCTCWVSASGDRNLTLINEEGDAIKTSVTVKRDIEDAKAYNNDILVTCKKGQQVIRLSEEGAAMSIFSEFLHYITWGLCVTNEMDILVCLQSQTVTDAEFQANNKVVRLGKNGHIIQSIQKDSKGHPLYRFPYRVAALPSGEILVTQLNNSGVVCVDRQGQHLFTWAKLEEEKQAGGSSTYGITHDNYNIFVTDFRCNKVYVLRKDYTVAKCLPNNPEKVVRRPWAIALEDRGKLLVGCDGGTIHVIEYSGWDIIYSRS